MTGMDTPDEHQAEIAEFPMRRAAGCPFDPPPGLRAMQRQGPLTKVRLWNGSTPWLVTRQADQRALLRDRRLSADFTKPGYPSPIPIDKDATFIASFPLMDDPEHARLRRMVQGPFAVKRVEAMRPAVQRIVDEAIDTMLAGPNPVDLVTAFALPVPSLVICELLGVPYDDHAFFETNSAVMIRQDVTPEERAGASERLLEYLRVLLRAKTAAPANDLLSALAAQVEAGELSSEEAVQMSVLVLSGGHETTANMIALGTVALLQHPDQLDLLRGTDDPQLIASAVEELLRFLNISHTGMRRAVLEDVEVAGQVIRAGEGVIMANDIGSRDPDAFSGDPERLDLRRDARRHLAFSFGVHQCLGQTLARMELQVIYSTLYRRIPTLKLATELEKVPFKHDGIVYGVYELPVAW